MRKSRAWLVLVAVLALLQALPGAALVQRDTGESAAPLAFPGVQVEREGDTGGCTLAFLAKVPAMEPDKKDRFFGLTAGHCIKVADAADSTWEPGEGPTAAVRVRDSDGPIWSPQPRLIGHFVYATYTTESQLTDFAVIELDDGVPFDPAVCFFGGPTGLDTSRRTGPETLSHIGHGLPLRPRQLTTDDLRRDVIYAQGATSQGDSGGPVLAADGAALGIVRGVGTRLLDDDAQFQGAGTQVMRLDAMLARTRQATGLDLQILTAPLSGKTWPHDAVGEYCTTY